MARPPLPERRAPTGLETTASGAMSEEEKEAITFRALGLLNEQVQARIVHYRSDLATSPELDAVTAQVVAQIQAMQQALAGDTQARQTPEEMESEHIRVLTRLLGRAFKEGSAFVTASLKPIGRRVAKLFFESELHEKTKGDRERRIYHGEQGLYYVLKRYKHRMRAELDAFDYVSEEVHAATLALLEKTEKELQVAFLSRRSPELNRVMHIFTAVLLEFLIEHLPPRVEQVARLTVRSARTARQPSSVGYKILVESFPAFRHEWERVFMEQMVNYCGDQLLGRLSEPDEEIHDETVKFFTDPQIFSQSGEVLCDALYDFLCLEGFLDLPVDWRVQHARDA